MCTFYTKIIYSSFEISTDLDIIYDPNSIDSVDLIDKSIV